ncbi:MAG: DUF2207 domain-containing protein [Parvularculaceae bacterium]|nr:DUF2207 domain-containing protein [Parvularculaceae bacterium]
MTALRAIAVFFLALLFAAPALAVESITDFDVSVDVERDGDIRVTEEIRVQVEGREIRRGIFRDLPRLHRNDGRNIPYVYNVKSVMRDGRKEPFQIEKDGNAFRIRIGDAEQFLVYGQHQYKIVYEVKNQVRYFDGHDEIYWNATGNYWAFPIDAARVRIRLPGGAGAVQTASYVGAQGERGRAADYTFSDGAHGFSAMTLARGEGLTVAVGFEKGVVDPPSAADARAEWWALNGSLAVLGAGLAAIAALYLALWNRIGRDPQKGPVFARYEPPQGYSPAAAHYIYHRGLSGHDALIATLINLGVHKRVEIDAQNKKKITLTRLNSDGVGGLADHEIALEQKLLIDKGGSLTFGGKYNAAFTGAYTQFRSTLEKVFGPPYFRWNRGFLILAAALSVVVVIIAANLAIEWTALHTIAVGTLALMAAAGSYFLPAPTPKGQAVRTEIEGFRLYLETAEKLHLNAVEVGSGAPPPMTVERYEKFLPYAVALGVERPWTEHFDKLLPQEAADYNPHWSRGNFSGGRSLSAVNSALVSGIASGVTASMPQSSSSSGSGGGGFSGGGGGGGGGGGW